MIKNSIVLVPFPFEDFSTTKVRPAVCLTHTIGKFEHVIIAFISSKIPDQLEKSDYIIEKDSSYWHGTGLNVTSVIRLHKIITIPKNLIKRKLGVINASASAEIFQKLFNLFKDN